MVQKINVEELRKAKEAEKDATARACIEAILARQRNGELRVEHRRKKAGEGRWYATARAQLQSCKREIRAAALRGMGWEIDLRASYPMIAIWAPRQGAMASRKFSNRIAAIARNVALAKRWGPDNFS